MHRADPGTPFVEVGAFEGAAASTHDVVREQVSVGLALGLPAAVVSGRVIASLLFDVRPWDPALLARAALFLIAATFVAAFIPARRAAALDPI